MNEPVILTAETADRWLRSRHVDDFYKALNAIATGRTRAVKVHTEDEVREAFRKWWGAQYGEHYLDHAPLTLRHEEAAWLACARHFGIVK